MDCIGLSKVLTPHSTHFRSFRRRWGDCVIKGSAWQKMVALRALKMQDLKMTATEKLTYMAMTAFRTRRSSRGLGLATSGYRVKVSVRARG